VKISVTIITFNEEAKIADAMRSVYWADEVLVVDSHSTDNTREIAAELGARVIERNWAGFADQKQFATDQAGNDVIFSLDADERVSDELAAEIKKIKESDNLAFDGYTIPRLSIYLGREIRHGSWYPDRQLRLFDRRKANWKQVVIHESVQIQPGATVGQLNGDIIHKSVDSIKHHAKMLVERYAPLGAQAMYERGKRTSALQIAAAGPVAFAKDYVLKAGFLDGVPGLTIAAFSAYHAALKHMMLYELQSGAGCDVGGGVK
jgi:glycosyltransferase involved in cell wall biosynthesis